VDDEQGPCFKAHNPSAIQGLDSGITEWLNASVDDLHDSTITPKL